MLNKTALVVAGSSDIGQGIVRQLVSDGYQVAAHYWQNVGVVEKFNNEFQQQGADVTWFQHDLRKKVQAQQLIHNAVQKYGSIGALINTIGPFDYRDVLEVTPDQWAESIDFNLNIIFNMVYYAQQYLCDSKGHIINFTFAGYENLKSWPMSTAYCAAKAGVAVLTKTLAARLAPKGVRVNAISPGLIEVEATTQQERIDMAKQIPAGRPGTPEDVARVLHWLLEESPDYITGSFTAVSGAWEY